MKFSDEANYLIFDINDYSEKSLKNIFEVSALIDSALFFGKKQDFKDLIFTAKYVNGLKSVLSGRNINDNHYIEKIFDEFNQNIQKFLDILKNIISQLEEKTSKQFNDKYFQMNQENIANTMELIGDLSLCKEYFNNNSNKLMD